MLTVQPHMGVKGGVRGRVSASDGISQNQTLRGMEEIWGDVGRPACSSAGKAGFSKGSPMGWGRALTSETDQEEWRVRMHAGDCEQRVRTPKPHTLQQL